MSKNGSRNTRTMDFGKLFSAGSKPVDFFLRINCYKLLQNPFSVILNAVNDLKLIENTIFFASLRMTS